MPTRGMLTGLTDRSLASVREHASAASNIDIRTVWNTERFDKAIRFVIQTLASFSPTLNSCMDTFQIARPLQSVSIDSVRQFLEENMAKKAKKETDSRA